MWKKGDEVKGWLLAISNVSFRYKIHDMEYRVRCCERYHFVSDMFSLCYIFTNDISKYQKHIWEIICTSCTYLYTWRVLRPMSHDKEEIQLNIYAFWFPLVNFIFIHRLYIIEFHDRKRILLGGHGGGEELVRFTAKKLQF